MYAGQWVSSIMSYLIITGSFACGMAFHNTTARYMYSLGTRCTGGRPGWRRRSRLLPSSAWSGCCSPISGSSGASSYRNAYWLGPIDLAVVLGGIAFAFYLKRRDPARCERAGRLINEGL